MPGERTARPPYIPPGMTRRYLCRKDHGNTPRPHQDPRTAPPQPQHRHHQRPHQRHPELERHSLPVVLSRLQGAVDQLLDPRRGGHEGGCTPVRRAQRTREERLRFHHRPAGHAGFAADAFHLQRRRVHHRPGRARQRGDHRPAGSDPQRELQLRAGFDHRPAEPEPHLRDRPHPPDHHQAQRADHGGLRRLHAGEDRRNPAEVADPVLDPGRHQLLFRFRVLLQHGAAEPHERHRQDHQLHQP
ncbi:hypothetical protein D3C72_1334780 [compost metagenome]